MDCLSGRDGQRGSRLRSARHARRLCDGKLADIVLLDANPLDDIKNTQAIWRVLKGGLVFDPEELRPERN